MDCPDDDDDDDDDDDEDDDVCNAKNENRDIAATPDCFRMVARTLID